MAHSLTNRARLPGNRREPRSLRVNSLGLNAANTVDMVRQIQRGFSFAALQTLESQSGVVLSELASALGIPERTLARRKADGKFTWEESERLLRLATVFENALELFEGDAPAAVNWLTTPKKALDSEVPLTYARTEVGAREVAQLIGRLEDGVFS